MCIRDRFKYLHFVVNNFPSFFTGNLKLVAKIWASVCEKMQFLDLNYSMSEKSYTFIKYMLYLYVGLCQEFIAKKINP